MLNISNNQLITMVRGDTFSFPLFINYCDNWQIYRYKLSSGECVQFRVMPAETSWEDAPIKKEYTKEDQNEDGDIMITFEAEDTLGLEPGTYYYEIKLLQDRVSEEGQLVNTIITRRSFIMLS